MQVTQDEVVSTIRWRLGLSVDANTARYQEIWDRLHRDPNISAQLERVARAVAVLHGAIGPPTSGTTDLRVLGGGTSQPGQIVGGLRALAGRTQHQVVSAPGRDHPRCR